MNGYVSHEDHRLDIRGLTEPFPTGTCFLTESTQPGRQKLADAVRIAAADRHGRYLFVDDHETARDMLVKVAQVLGIARNADSFDFTGAQARLDTPNYEPAVVVVDAKEDPNGRFTGIGMARAVKSATRFGGVPVVVFSTLSAKEEMAHAAREIDGAFVIDELDSQRINDIFRGR